MKIIRCKTFEELLKSIHISKEEFGFLAGGTDIMPALNRNVLAKNVFYDLAPFSKYLNYISKQKQEIVIGALVTLEQILENKMVRKHLPQLVRAIETMGTKPIRNMATLIGNIANASPIGDSIPVLMTIDTIINTAGIEGQRHIPINNFFLDYKKIDLNRDEIIESITIPINRVGCKYGFLKVGSHQNLGISKVNLAYAIGKNSVSFAAGGVDKMVVRLKTIEKNWNNKILDIETIIKLLKMDIRLISDVRSDKEYRKNILANWLWQLRIGGF